MSADGPFYIKRQLHPHPVQSPAVAPPAGATWNEIPETLLVVPCYNEAARLDLAAFAAFLDAAPDVGLVFVDDGSRDDTLAMLRAFAESCPARVAVVAQPVNGGKAEAVRQGLLFAAARKPTYTGFWDADLATPLETLLDFIALLRRDASCAWVIGARVQLLGRDIARRPARHYAGRLFATAASLVLGLPVYDTQCGAKLFRADARLVACLCEPFISRWVFDVELIARFRGAVGGARAARTSIHEYPLHAWRDVRGSKVGPGAFAWAAVELLRIYRRYRTDPSPAGGGATARAHPHGGDRLAAQEAGPATRATATSESPTR